MKYKHYEIDLKLDGKFLMVFILLAILKLCKVGTLPLFGLVVFPSYTLFNLLLNLGSEAKSKRINY